MPKADEPKYTTAMTTSPFGTEYTLATAGIIMSAEKLGQRDSIDLIAINLSSNDYVGHMFGPHSLEVQDMTFRTDQMLGKFLEYIDRHMKGEPWVMALSSDHGVAPIPEYAKTLGLPAGRDQLDLPALKRKLETALTDAFGEPQKGSKYIRELDDGNVYLNNDLPKLAGDQGWAARDLTRRVLLEESTIAIAFIREELITQAATEGLEQQFQRCYHPKRSGDVLFAQTPYQILGKTTATHGSPWQYDSHVPLLIYGAGVQGGRHGREVTPASIAPTLARILGVEPPPSCAVDALEEAIAKPQASAAKKK
jgi:predicted AlkP superfamily pyrophosphatase or phosphodiesterase